MNCVSVFVACATPLDNWTYSFPVESFTSENEKVKVKDEFYLVGG